MGRVQQHPPVKLVISILTNDLSLMLRAIDVLQERFGISDYMSDLLPFTFTSYYTEELGGNLQRKILSFKNLIQPEHLAEIKINTNDLEGFLSQGEGESRKINIDPGYISSDKLVLATTKNKGHRIYIGKGIFGEVTLQYKDRGFKPWKWTYDSYKSDDHLQFLKDVRKIYMFQLKQSNHVAQSM